MAVTSSMAAYRPIAPRNLPTMICRSVIGEVSEELDRARSLLLGIGPHRDHRQHEEDDDRDVRGAAANQVNSFTLMLPAPPMAMR